MTDPLTTASLIVSAERRKAATDLIMAELFKTGDAGLMVAWTWAVPAE